ncbi:MAG: NAD(P)H-dependent oxidoreductase [Verrucomicrobiota bacterium]|nr:NAD(P)H-dependent oxidoreductase [Verrucomicrobiota bacterium]
MAKYLVISTSGNSDSNSRRMGQLALAWLQKNGADCEWLDISQRDLPLCDADKCYAQPAAREISRIISAAAGIILSTPVYNYAVSAAAKNLVELTGSAWEDKIVGFLCAAGGMSSYMSVLSFASSLILDFRCVILPRFVYATGDAFEDGKLIDQKIAQRVEQLAADLMRFTDALTTR